MQTRVSCLRPFIVGNCMSAVLASLAEVDLHEMPDWEERGRWDLPPRELVEAIRRWFRARGYHYRGVRVVDGRWPEEAIPAGVEYVGVSWDTGLRCPNSIHNTVCDRRGQVVHDPYPGGLPVQRPLCVIWLEPVRSRRRSRCHA